jgi:hypothetical protein
MKCSIKTPKTNADCIIQWAATGPRFFNGGDSIGGRPRAALLFAPRSCTLALSHDYLIERTEERRVELVGSSLSDLHKKGRELCYRDGMAWSLEDLKNRVSGVTMLTLVADEKKRHEYLNRAKVMLKGDSR